jgi:hypothetical protein
MKTLITLALIALVGCSIPSGEHYNLDRDTEPSYDYKVVVIDGCQYIEVNEGIGQTHTYTITHKGNCNNPIHHEHTRQ